MSNLLLCSVDGKQNASVYISHILFEDLFCMCFHLLDHRPSSLLFLLRLAMSRVFESPVPCVKGLTETDDISKADDPFAVHGS